MDDFLVRLLEGWNASDAETKVLVMITVLGILALAFWPEVGAED